MGDGWFSRLLGMGDREMECLAFKALFLFLWREACKELRNFVEKAERGEKEICELLIIFCWGRGDGNHINHGIRMKGRESDERGKKKVLVEFSSVIWRDMFSLDLFRKVFPNPRG